MNTVNAQIFGIWKHARLQKILKIKLKRAIVLFIYTKGKRIYLSRLIVKKEYRKQGIGNKLIEFAVNKATQFGYSEISLGVNCDNHAAYRLYLNNGFFVFETARDEYGKYYKMLKNVKGSDMNVEPQGNAGHYDQKAPAQRDQGK